MRMVMLKGGGGRDGGVEKSMDDEWEGSWFCS